MNNARFWILLLAGVAFLAGMGTGILYADKTHSQARIPTALGEFELAFLREFQLDPERRQYLAQAIDLYNRETQEIQELYAAEYHTRMEPDLRRVGLEFRAMTRALLPEEQRPKFDRLMASHVQNL